MSDNLTEHQQKTMQEIRQHLHSVNNSSQGLVESLWFGVINNHKFIKNRKNKMIIFSLDELKTLIKLIYKLFEVHEEV